MLIEKIKDSNYVQLYHDDHFVLYKSIKSVRVHWNGHSLIGQLYINLNNV